MNRIASTARALAWTAHVTTATTDLNTLDGFSPPVPLYASTLIASPPHCLFLCSMVCSWQFSSADSRTPPSPFHCHRHDGAHLLTWHKRASRSIAPLSCVPARTADQALSPDWPWRSAPPRTTRRLKQPTAAKISDAVCCWSFHRAATMWGLRLRTAQGRSQDGRDGHW